MSETEWEMDQRCKESSDMKVDYWIVKRKKKCMGKKKIESQVDKKKPYFVSQGNGLTLKLSQLEQRTNAMLHQP